MVSDRGGKYGYVVASRQDTYKDIREERGLSKSYSAAISNKGRTKAGRAEMAKKAAATRRLRGKKRN